MDYSRKNPKMRGVEDMEFPGGTEERVCGNSKGQLKEVEIPGVFKKNSSGISMGLGFDLGISKGCHTILQNIQG